MNWIDITSTEIESGQFGNTNIFEGFRDNAHAAYSNIEAIRGFGYAHTVGNWTVPAGVYRIKVTLTGSGGSGGDNGASYDDGEDATFGTLTAAGGKGGGPAAGDGYGGTAAGGDININGGDFIRDVGGMSYWGSGTGMDLISGPFNNIYAYGSGGTGDNNGYAGGAAATIIKVLDVLPGEVFAYDIPNFNSGFDASFMSGGCNGILIIEY